MYCSVNKKQRNELASKKQGNDLKCEQEKLNELNCKQETTKLTRVQARNNKTN